MLRTFDEKDLVSVVFYDIKCFIYKDIAHAIDIPYDQFIKPLSLYKECLIIAGKKTVIEIFFRDSKDFESAKTQFLAAKEKVSTYGWTAALWKTSPASVDFLIQRIAREQANGSALNQHPIEPAESDGWYLKDLKKDYFKEYLSDDSTGWCYDLDFNKTDRTRAFKPTIFGNIVITQIITPDGYDYVIHLPKILDTVLPMRHIKPADKVPFICEFDIQMLTRDVEKHIRDRIWNSFKIED